MRHLGFPLRLDGRGRTAVVGEEEYLRGLVELVLFTRPGERVNRPELGSGVDQLVFTPSGDETGQVTQALVHSALLRWAGEQIRVEAVTVVAEDSRLEVTVAYAPVLAAPGTPPRRLQVSGGAP